MQTEQLLCWSGMTDTEHSITSSSNEEASGCFSKNSYEWDLNGNRTNHKFFNVKEGLLDAFTDSTFYL